MICKNKNSSHDKSWSNLLNSRKTCFLYLIYYFTYYFKHLKMHFKLSFTFISLIVCSLIVTQSKWVSIQMQLLATCILIWVPVASPNLMEIRVIQWQLTRYNILQVTCHGISVYLLFWFGKTSRDDWIWNKLLTSAW